MAPNPLVVLCSAAVVLIALATVATSAPVEAKAEDRQQRQQLDASESRSAKPDEHQQQHHQQHQQHQRQQEKQQQHLQHQQQQQQQLQGIGPLVNSLLTSLLRQTLYTRMENLLLDGSSSSSQFPSEVSPSYPSHPESVRKSGERRRIVDSAVRNYQEQDGGLSQDFTKLAGYWIRETPEPRVLGSTFFPTTTSISSTTEAVDFGTEKYKITDLFTTTTSTTTTESPEEAGELTENS